MFKKLFLVGYCLLFCGVLFASSNEQPESIPFEISKWRERRTTIKGIGPLTLWGNNT